MLESESLELWAMPDAFNSYDKCCAFDILVTTVKQMVFRKKTFEVMKAAVST